MDFKYTPLWSLIFILQFLSTLAFAQQATKADLQALETKVSNLEKTTHDIDKRLIRLETNVDEMDKRLTTHIVELDKRLTARIDLLFWAIGALIGIVLTVIALPQLLGYFQEKRGREDLQRQIQDLNRRLEDQQRSLPRSIGEIEELRSRRIVAPDCVACGHEKAPPRDEVHLAGRMKVWGVPSINGGGKTENQANRVN